MTVDTETIYDVEFSFTKPGTDHPLIGVPQVTAEHPVTTSEEIQEVSRTIGKANGYDSVMVLGIAEHVDEEVTAIGTITPDDLDIGDESFDVTQLPGVGDE